LGDSTPAIGWLYKSGKLLPDSAYIPVQLILKVARLITASTHCLASQHLKGDQNKVSDLLSFAGDAEESLTLSPSIILPIVS
jgi:hypothetical protein